MRTLAAVFFTVAALWSVSAAYPSDRSPKTSKVVVDILRCPEMAQGEMPRVLVDDRIVSIRTISTKPWLRVEMHLPKGQHAIEIGNANCQLYANLYVVPGHDRNFMAILSHGRLVADFKNYIFGTIPLNEGSASIIDAAGTETPAVLDHGVYAAEYLDTGTYTLRFALPTSHMQVRIAVTVGKGANRRDITEDDIVRNVGRAFVLGADRKLHFKPLWGDSQR